MFLKQDFNLIITVVASGHCDSVIASAKSAGAEGATIINARGNSIHESDTILGVSIQPEKEVVLVLVRKQIRKKVMREICKNNGLSDEGQGICFSLPVDEIGGINHLLNIKKPTPKRTSTTDNTKSAQKTEQKTEAEPKKEIAEPEKKSSKTEDTSLEPEKKAK